MATKTTLSSEEVWIAFSQEAKFLGGLEPADLSNWGLVSAISGSSGYVSPVTRNDLKSDLVISDFCQWRNENLHAFLDQNSVSIESTKVWLEKMLASGEKILFKVISPSQQMIGHIGLAWNTQASRLEVDNVIRGIPGEPGIMGDALEHLERYASVEFNAQSLSLRVLPSNEHAIRFYKKHGYTLEEPNAEDFTEHSLGNSVDPNYFVMTKSLVRQFKTDGQILTAGPSIGFRERAYTAEAVHLGWNHRSSEFLQRLESSFSEFVGVPHALATSSCTGALHLALAALDVGPGDEVLVPAITWVASASAVRYVGAQPIFVDVDPESWTLDPTKIEEKITPRTKAILVVHMYGFVAHVQQIKELCERRGLFLVEDAAPAIGANFEGARAGTFGHFGCFSFQGAKLLVSGEGGMLVSNSPQLFARAKKLQDHGRRPGSFVIDELGYKYKMSNQTAALALGQLERIQPQIDRKRLIAGWYRELLADSVGLNFQNEISGSESIHWMNSVAVELDSPGEHGNELRTLLSERGIDSRPVFPNLARFEFWRQDPQEFPVSEFLAGNAINLPSGVNLSLQDVERVAFAIKESIKQLRSR